jgi:hypothetical protein
MAFGTDLERESFAMSNDSVFIVRPLPASNVGPASWVSYHGMVLPSCRTIASAPWTDKLS